MSAAYETTFDESRPADLARSLRLMAATVPPDGTVEVTLTPVAARLAARSIEAGLAFEKSMADQPAFEWVDHGPGSSASIGWVMLAVAALCGGALALVLT
jgi:hypothetical protein